jgi:hypothetical protein
MVLSVFSYVERTTTVDGSMSVPRRLPGVVPARMSESPVTRVSLVAVSAARLVAHRLA